MSKALLAGAGAVVLDKSGLEAGPGDGAGAGAGAAGARTGRNATISLSGRGERPFHSVTPNAIVCPGVALLLWS